MTMLTKSKPLTNGLLPDLLTPDMAERVLAYKLSKAKQERLTELAGKANEGELSAEERREYALCVGESDVISILKAAARRVLGEEV